MIIKVTYEWDVDRLFFMSTIFQLASEANKAMEIRIKASPIRLERTVIIPAAKAFGDW